MPLYDYECLACGPFEALRSISRREEPAACPACAQDADRVLISAPRLADMDPFTRIADAAQANKTAHWRKPAPKWTTANPKRQSPLPTNARG